MKKVLVIGLGNQGDKYVNYFIKNNYVVYGVCKTNTTKEKIENKYGIKVSLDYRKLDFLLFDIIIICLPPEIQGFISLEILESGFKNKLIIEIPVTWDKIELEKLKQYNNAIFYLEENYTLLSQFLRKINVNEIKDININIITNEEDYNNLRAREVTYIHINNNFLGLGLNKNIIKYDFTFHDSENIYYEIIFNYKGSVIKYNFKKYKYLLVGEKKFLDDYNFDFVLKKIIEGNDNFSKYYLI